MLVPVYWSLSDPLYVFQVLSPSLEDATLTHNHVLEWHSKSSELNTIENLWQNIKTCIHVDVLSAQPDSARRKLSTFQQAKLTCCWNRVIFLPFHNKRPVCVNLSHKIQFKYTKVCACNKAKCKKVHWMRILLPGSVRRWTNELVTAWEGRRSQDLFLSGHLLSLSLVCSLCHRLTL